jgi:hypothetical protein
MKEVWKEIGEGDSAVAITVKDMCRLAGRDARNPKIRALASTLADGKTSLQAARAAFEHVVRSIRYVSDPDGIEKIVAPIYLLSLVRPYQPYGDCDDMCLALGSLLLAMGHGVKFRVLAHRVDDYTHVNTVAIVDGRDVPLDPVMGMAGWNNQKWNVRREKYTECSMKQLSLEDGPMIGGRPLGSLACETCGKRKCRCGRRRGCCPQNANDHNAPVNVNVITNSGAIDTYSENQMDQSRNALIPIMGERQVIERQTNTIREVPKNFAVTVPAPQVHQDQPVIVQYAPLAKPKTYREWY